MIFATFATRWRNLNIHMRLYCLVCERSCLTEHSRAEEEDENDEAVAALDNEPMRAVPRYLPRLPV